MNAWNFGNQDAPWVGSKPLAEATRLKNRQRIGLQILLRMVNRVISGGNLHDQSRRECVHPRTARVISVKPGNERVNRKLSRTHVGVFTHGPSRPHRILLADVVVDAYAVLILIVRAAGGVHKIIRVGDIGCRSWNISLQDRKDALIETIRLDDIPREWL